ncbi:hypothetical protein [Cellulosimicrobium marinum]|uniref:hypothetical protein n=1 Tax=Cellulosimicrobium marinum TaxID=1638992 RepID=UPI001E3D6D5B|nr:hypothetical protein [Cellulosimicrobium marinum]MCB7137440.1 hypothetical protein [Cellulosimicrobium marinum]
MVEIVFRVRDWHLVDGTLDNTGAVERVGGDEALAEAAGRLREAGWAAAAQHPRVQPGWGWPPEDDDLAVTLDRGDWALVVSELHRWADVGDLQGDRQGDPLGADDAASSRRIARAIEARLADPAADGTAPGTSAGTDA